MKRLLRDMTSISLTLAKLEGYRIYKRKHPENYKNISYIPSISELLKATKQYLGNYSRTDKSSKIKTKNIENKF